MQFLCTGTVAGSQTLWRIESAFVGIVLLLLCPSRGEEYCDHPVCLCVSVCSPVYLLNRWTDLYELLSAGPLWPLLSLQPAALCYVVYFRFYG